MYYNKEMKDKVNSIRNIIENDFDGRMEVALFSYIIEKGIDYLSQLTDERIEEEIKEDQGLLGRDFLIAMVKTAARLSREFDIHDLMTYIRMELWMTPSIKQISAYKDEDDVWNIDAYKLDLYDLETDEVNLYVVVEEE